MANGPSFFNLLCDPTFVYACGHFYFFPRHGGCRPEVLLEGSDDGSPPTAGPLVGGWGWLLIRGAERRRGGVPQATHRGFIFPPYRGRKTNGEWKNNQLAKSRSNIRKKFISRFYVSRRKKKRET